MVVVERGVIGNRSAALTERVVQGREGDIGHPSIVAHKLYFSAYKSRKVDCNLETLRLLFRALAVVEFDREDVCESGEIRAVPPSPACRVS